MIDAGAGNGRLTERFSEAVWFNRVIPIEPNASLGLIFGQKGHGAERTRIARSVLQAERAERTRIARSVLQAE